MDGYARYVDVAVMAPVHPARHQTPALLAGPHAASLEPILTGLDMRVSVAGLDIGAAAAIKNASTAADSQSSLRSELLILTNLKFFIIAA